MALACILVLKYRKGDDDSLMEKISKLNIHSIIKKSNRVSSHLKHLTGFAPQVSSMLAACRTALQGLGTAAGMAWHRTFLVSPWFCLLMETGPFNYQAAYNVHRGK